MDFEFNIGGDLERVLGAIDKQLDVFQSALVSSGKTVDQLDSALKRLDKGFQLASIEAMENPLKQQAALLKMARNELVAKAAADAKLAAEDKAYAKAAAEAAAANAAAANGAATWEKLARDFGTGTQAATRLEKELKALERQEKLAAAAAEKDPTKQRAALMKIYADDVKQADDAQQHATGSSLGWAAELSQVGTFLLSAGEKAFAFAQRVIQIGVSFAEAALHVSEFNQNIRASFEAALGSTDKANAAFADMQNAADKAGLKVEDVGKSMRNLANAGFDQDQIRRVFAAGTDISAQMGGGEAGKAALDQFEEMATKIKTLGKVSERELPQLASMGIKKDDVLKAIAELKHVSTKGAEQLLKSGELGGSEALEAILATVQKDLDKGGKLGSRALQFASTNAEAGINRLSNAWERLLGRFKGDAIGKIINKIADALDGTSASGQKLQAIFDDVFDTIEKVFSGVDDDTITKTIDGIVSVLDTLWKMTKAYGAAFQDAFVPALKKIEPLWNKVFGGENGTKNMDRLIEVAGFMGKLFAYDLVAAITAVLKAVDAFEQAWDVLSRDFDEVGASIDRAVAMFDGLYDSIASVFEKIRSMNVADIGRAIVDGLKSGVENAWDGLVKKFESLIAKLPASARKVLGIASPSKVFHGIGGHTAAGFQQGVEGGDVPELPMPKMPSLPSLEAPSINAPSLGSDVAAPPRMPAPMSLPESQTSAAAGAAAASAGGGGGGSKSMTATFEVNVNLSGGGGAAGGAGGGTGMAEAAKEAAQEFSKQFRAEFMAWADGMGIGVGGV